VRFREGEVQEAGRRWHRVRAALTVLAVLAVVAGLPLLAQGYRELRGRKDVRQVEFQFAGTRDAACKVVQPGAAGCPVPDAAVERYRSAVRADWYLVAGYILAGAGVFGLGALFLYGSGAKRVTRWCLGGVALAGRPTPPRTWLCCGDWPPSASPRAATSPSPWPPPWRC
jgi:hypothetical protein